MHVQHPVLDAIHADADRLRALETACVEERRLTDESAKILRESGVMRLLQPRRYGGHESTPQVFNAAMHDIARQSSSAGWVTGVVGVHSWHLGLYDDRAQREVWGEDPDTWISSSYSPAGTARPVPGGYELNGRWGFSSGSDHCGWVFVGAMVLDEDGARTGRMLHLLLPRGDYTIDDVWFTSGLAGTGSNDIVVEGAFVPRHRTHDVADLYAERYPGNEVNTAGLFRMPWYTVFVNAVVMPLVGMARRVHDEALAIHRGRLAVDPSKLPHPASLALVAEADGAVDTAYRILQANAVEAFEAVTDGGRVSLGTRQRTRRDHVAAVGLAVSAADKSYQVGGPRSIASSSPLQAVWRDVHAGQHHAVNVPDLANHEYGTYLLTGAPGTIY
ncbi:flavin-dependent monooxygenase [Nocardioides nitrophenolicus]|uniref:flavin-dependent monooxygenase n=1 Tax=Nocardioides nitrophenolicus TaxID=60489 RepID=UPI00195C994F|nr:flavin-dependent monooxygenase [Nocardioides nitrophenolicus]MBM7519327.1 3-hydroxy-9,10-secoandrosta-1,3,5(10)-triene-9,17-dione monooxygenase [Nocardioides nitrophenolicus]